MKPTPNEHQIWSGTPSQLSAIGRYIGIGAFFVFLLPIAFVSIWTFLFFFLMFGGVAGLVFLTVRSTRFEITNQRIKKTSGILGKRREQIELYRVKDIAVDEPFILRLRQLGNLTVYSNDRTSSKIEINGIPSIEEVSESLRAAIEECRAQKGVRITEMEFWSGQEPQCSETYANQIGAGNYGAGECHDIAKWLCGIRDFENEPDTVEKLERMLQAFINRKKLGIPVTTKKYRAGVWISALTSRSNPLSLIGLVYFPVR